MYTACAQPHILNTYSLNKHTLIGEADREIFNITTTILYVYAFRGQQMRKKNQRQNHHMLI